MRTRLHPADRKEAIMNAALAAAVNCGYQSVTRKTVAEFAGCSEALVSAYFGTMVQMRQKIVLAAIEQCNLYVIAQAIVAKDPRVKHAPAELQELALIAVS